MNLLSELVAALRFWTRRPLVAMASIVSLAVGLAVASSVFAVADAALWRPLPIPGAERVVWIDSVDRGVPGNTAPGVFSAWVSGAVSFEAMGAMRASESIFRDDRPGQRVAGAYATAGAMKVLAVQPVLGRAISEQDDRPGAPLVLVISDRFWRSQYRKFAVHSRALGHPRRQGPHHRRRHERVDRQRPVRIRLVGAAGDERRTGSQHRSALSPRDRAAAIGGLAGRGGGVVHTCPATLARSATPVLHSG